MSLRTPHPLPSHPRDLAGTNSYKLELAATVHTHDIAGSTRRSAARPEAAKVV